MITSVDGTIKPALDIFAHAIRYLKDQLLNAVKLETGRYVSMQKNLILISTSYQHLVNVSTYLSTYMFQENYIS